MPTPKPERMSMWRSRAQQDGPVAPAATRRLWVALAEGDDPICAGDGRFIADDPATGAEVARYCHGCPYLALCREAGQHERVGVWGGVDVATPSPEPHHQTNA